MEGVTQLDPSILEHQDSGLILKHRYVSQSIIKRFPDNLTLIGIIIAFISNTILMVQNGRLDYYYGSILVIVIILFWKKLGVRGTYKIDEKGLIIPYSWITRKLIPWDSIIEYRETKATDNDNNEVYAIYLGLDVTFLKFNKSGLKDPRIVLTSNEFEQDDLKNLLGEVEKYKRKSTQTPNSVTQRIMDQVNIAWNKRWLLVLVNTLDYFSEFLFYLFIIESVLYGVVLISLFPILGLVLSGMTLILIILAQIGNKPKAIVGIRSNELGALIYNEEEVITMVRFVVISHPHTIQLKNCELIFDDNGISQIEKLKQIQPEFIEPGELRHGVAQILGNHTKAVGAKIFFSYKGSKDDITYEIVMRWN